MHNHNALVRTEKKYCTHEDECCDYKNWYLSVPLPVLPKTGYKILTNNNATRWQAHL